MKRYAFIFLTILLLPQVIFGANSDFARSLKLGMRGDDVRNLQKLLNSDPFTRIAERGAGAPGNETDYFGPATKRALVKFQEKYRDETLTPAGLTHGSGFFGENTRKKANALQTAAPMSASVEKTSAPSTTATTAPSTLASEVYIMSLSQYSGKPGTSVTINGEGFALSDNTIYFGNTHAVLSARSFSGQSINIRIPDIPKGLYTLSVKNANGESDTEAFFVVTDGVTSEPKIENISLSADNMITIKGSGFLVEGNVVRTGINVYRSVPSADGKTIVLPVITNFGNIENTSAPTISVERPKEIKQFSFPVWTFVVNNDGVSNSVNFTLAL